MDLEHGASCTGQSYSYAGQNRSGSRDKRELVIYLNHATGLLTCFDVVFAEITPGFEIA
jgi:hypothetical protein